MKIFISYAREDENYKIELLKHFKELERKKIIDGWHDGKIKPGEAWEESVKNALRECEVVLFLVSADFLASDYINKTEIKIAFERYEKGEIKIIPVILRPCIWDENELSKFQALPKKGKPLSTWKNIDDGLYDVVKGIAKIVEHDSDLKQNEQEVQNISSSRNDELKAGIVVNNTGANIGKQININEVNDLNIN